MSANHHSALYHVPWTEDEDARLAELWAQEEPTTPEIAKAMKRTERAVIGRAKVKKLGSRPGRNARRDFWTEERLKQLKAMFDDGMSFVSMAAEIGEGCTRNAAIGKVGRMGWTRSDSSWAANRRRATQVASAASAEAARRRRAAGLPPKTRRPRANQKVAGYDPSAAFRAPHAPILPFPRAQAFRPLMGFEPVDVVDLKPSHCRWPVEVGGETLFCGRTKADHRYCRTHQAASSGEGTGYERSAVKDAERIPA